MTGLIKTKAIAEALGKPRKSVLDRAEREGWIGVQRSGGAIQWQENRLPVDVRLALSCRNDAVPSKTSEQVNEEAAIAGHVFANASERARQEATWRCSLIAAWKQSSLKKDDFLDAYNAGTVSKAIYEQLGNVSIATFYRWLKEFKSSGPSGVTPRHGMGAKGSGASLSQTEKELLEYFWLRDTQPTIQHALTLMKHNAPYSRCTYQTANRYLKSLPKPLIDFKRLGKTRFTNAHLPYMNQNIFQYRSLDVVVSDHHCLDSVVMYNKRLIRPWVTTFQDYRSGKILGWCPSVKPSSLSIIAAYYMAVITHGIPVKVLFDNGQDYRSIVLNGSTEKAKVLTPEMLEEEQEVYIQGLFCMVGTEVAFTQVYNGKSNGRQERFFRTLGEYFAKDLGGYVGSDSRTRPEDAQLYFRPINKQAKRYDIPDWADFVSGLDAIMRYINDRLPSSGKGMDGKTATETFSANLPAEVRWAEKETLRLALTRGEIRKVRNSMVQVGGIDYYHPDLFRYSGQQVIVRQKLTSDDEVIVCDLKGALIGTAIGNYFLEGERLDESTERLRSAQKHSLRMLAEMGSNEVKAAPEYETMVAVAQNMYRQNEIVDVDEYLSLPAAVGAEAVREKVPAKIKEVSIRRKLKNPLDATAEDYL